VDGVARTNYRIERSGVLEISAYSTNGARSSVLRLDTVSGGVTVVPPTPQPTFTVTPTPTATVTPTVTVTPTPIPPVTVQVTDWLSVLVLVIASAIGVALLAIRRAVMRWGMRWALCGVIGGLLAYNYLAFGFPGSQAVLRYGGLWGTLLVTLSGVLVGWLIGFVWRLLEKPGLRSDKAGHGGTDRTVTGPKSQSN